MAHNIYQHPTSKQHSVMTVDKSWHGLGQIVTGPKTAEETIQLSGIDYDVVKQPLFLSDGRQVPNRMATVRTDTDEYLGVVGKSYSVLQNRQAFSFFDGIVNRDEAIYTSAGVLGNGEKMWLQAKLPEHVMVNGEQYNEYLLFSNSHDGKSPIDVRFTPVRVVCENTMNAALNSKSIGIYKVRHSANANAQLSEGAKIMNIANNYFKEIEIMFDKLAHTKISEEDKQEHFKQVILGNAYKHGIKLSTKADNILFEMEQATRQCPKNEQFEGTALEIFNGITYYADHWKEYRMGTNFEGSLFGSGIITRNRSMKLLAELV